MAGHHISINLPLSKAAPGGRGRERGDDFSAPPNSGFQFVLLFFIIIAIKLEAAGGANIDFGEPLIFPLVQQSDQIFYFQISSPISQKQTFFTMHIVNFNITSLLELL